MIKLQFKQEDKARMKTWVLKDAYRMYAGVIFPSVLKECEFDFLLECAETDLVNDGRNLEKEVYDALVSEMVEDFRISLFGQWCRSTCGQPREALQKARSLFMSSEEFYSFMKKRVDCSGFRAQVKAVFEGTENPKKLPFGT
jgi:hypothetical protein